MTLVDRVWRTITQPVPPPKDPNEPQLLQVIQYEHWAYPVYLDGFMHESDPPRWRVAR